MTSAEESEGAPGVEAFVCEFPVAKTAIISDIHANLEALQTVLADIDRQEIGEILCLGDVVGYGPDPAECIDLVQVRCKFTLRGNHDVALIDGPHNFTHMARQAIEWTRKTLKPRFWRAGSAERWKFLENLPERIEWNGYLLVHGSPRDPTSEYIMDRDLFVDAEKFREIFSMFEKVCFVGHTHVPGVFYDYESPRFVPQKDIDGSFRFEQTKMVINVGSVGQPRDRDPRACYLTVDHSDGTFRYQRLEYDLEKTRQKVYANPSLSPQLGDRLAEGI